jgi:alkylation response protein AidB-like acyl-CoA dehydrogenase
VCFQDALHYAHKRKTFGKKLIDHAILKDKFARESGKLLFWALVLFLTFPQAWPE